MLMSNLFGAAPSVTLPPPASVRQPMSETRRRLAAAVAFQAAVAHALAEGEACDVGAVGRAALAHLAATAAHVRACLAALERAAPDEPVADVDELAEQVLAVRPLLEYLARSSKAAAAAPEPAVDRYASIFAHSMPSAVPWAAAAKLNATAVAAYERVLRGAGALEALVAEWERAPEAARACVAAELRDLAATTAIELWCGAVSHPWLAHAHATTARLFGEPGRHYGATTAAHPLLDPWRASCQRAPLAERRLLLVASVVEVLARCAGAAARGARGEAIVLRMAAFASSCDGAARRAAGDGVQQPMRWAVRAARETRAATKRLLDEAREGAAADGASSCALEALCAALNTPCVVFSEAATARALRDAWARRAASAGVGVDAPVSLLDGALFLQTAAACRHGVLVPLDVAVCMVLAGAIGFHLGARWRGRKGDRERVVAPGEVDGPFVFERALAVAVRRRILDGPLRPAQLAATKRGPIVQAVGGGDASAAAAQRAPKRIRHCAGAMHNAGITGKLSEWRMSPQRRNLRECAKHHGPICTSRALVCAEIAGNVGAAQMAPPESCYDGAIGRARRLAQLPRATSGGDATTPTSAISGTLIGPMRPLTQEAHCQVLVDIAAGNDAAPLSGAAAARELAWRMRALAAVHYDPKRFRAQRNDAQYPRLCAALALARRDVACTTAQLEQQPDAWTEVADVLTPRASRVGKVSLATPPSRARAR